MQASCSVGAVFEILALLGFDELPCRVSGQQADQVRKAPVRGGQGRGRIPGRFCDHPEPFRNCLPPPCHRPVPLPARQDPRQHERGAGKGEITGGFGRIASSLGAAQRKPALPRLLQGALRGGIHVGWRKNTGKARDISRQGARSAGFRS
ncbi:hypothetical protein Pden_3327 [Paracoccus denitrificans PD1222]|uniref:Uncharacterized protein n=1 Tax=Paracoccus denitrificans (strain Pd 1222) TaxID=318586 RepID=A1B7A9_PARDP|nr:hypothetical protein Pden_3327 [Paracoccus denitrificans PD1222]